MSGWRKRSAARPLIAFSPKAAPRSAAPSPALWSTRALVESQNERDELRDIGRLLVVISEQRDALFAENQRLRGVIERLRAAGDGDEL